MVAGCWNMPVKTQDTQENWTSRNRLQVCKPLFLCLSGTVISCQLFCMVLQFCVEVCLCWMTFGWSQNLCRSFVLLISFVLRRATTNPNNMTKGYLRKTTWCHDLPQCSSTAWSSRPLEIAKCQRPHALQSCKGQGKHMESRDRRNYRDH